MFLTQTGSDSLTRLKKASKFAENEEFLIDISYGNRLVKRRSTSNIVGNGAVA